LFISDAHLIFAAFIHMM